MLTWSQAINCHNQLIKYIAKLKDKQNVQEHLSTTSNQFTNIGLVDYSVERQKGNDLCEACPCQSNFNSNLWRKDKTSFTDDLKLIMNKWTTSTTSFFFSQSKNQIYLHLVHNNANKLTYKSVVVKMNSIEH